MKSDFRNKPAVAAEPLNTEEEIRRRAYELFEIRGREDGHELDDWLRAEKELAVGKSHAVAA